MKKILVPAAALTLCLMTVGVGLAQAEEPANCADAITALQRADADHRAAVVADEKAAAAEKADDDLERAEGRLADAERDLGAANDRLTQAQARIDDAEPPLTGQALADATAARDDAKEDRDDARRVRDDRLNERDDARDLAEDTDAAALQDEADKTDAGVLKKAVDAARDDFNRICINEDDPTDDVTTTPATPAPAPEVTVVIPNGGVNTGGGPA